jgi:hypothetical protein
MWNSENPSIREVQSDLDVSTLHTTKLVTGCQAVGISCFDPHMKQLNEDLKEEMGIKMPRILRMDVM